MIWEKLILILDTVYDGLHANQAGGKISLFPTVSFRLLCEVKTILLRPLLFVFINHCVMYNIPLHWGLKGLCIPDRLSSLIKNSNTAPCRGVPRDKALGSHNAQN